MSNTGRAQALRNSLNRIYEDETHCLVAPEVLNERDKPISCFCRDALTDARYLFHTYILSMKDGNLNGAYLILERHAAEICGGYDAVRKTERKDWQWNGPEVIRKYPPDREIEQIKPDKNGTRNVLYQVYLTYRDPQGRVAKVESFKVVDKFPPGYRKLACPPSSVCPK